MNQQLTHPNAVDVVHDVFARALDISSAPNNSSVAGWCQALAVEDKKSWVDFPRRLGLLAGYIQEAEIQVQSSIKRPEIYLTWTPHAKKAISHSSLGSGWNNTLTHVNRDRLNLIKACAAALEDNGHARPVEIDVGKITSFRTEVQSLIEQISIDNSGMDPVLKKYILIHALRMELALSDSLVFKMYPIKSCGYSTVAEFSILKMSDAESWKKIVENPLGKKFLEYADKMFSSAAESFGKRAGELGAEALHNQLLLTAK